MITISAAGECSLFRNSDVVMFSFEIEAHSILADNLIYTHTTVQALLLFGLVLFCVLAWQNKKIVLLLFSRTTGMIVYSSSTFYSSTSFRPCLKVLKADKI